MATPLAKAIIQTTAYLACAIISGKRTNKMTSQQIQQRNQAIREGSQMTAQAWKDYKNSK